MSDDIGFERTRENLRYVLTGDENDDSADLVFDEGKQRAKYNKAYYEKEENRGHAVKFGLDDEGNATGELQGIFKERADDFNAITEAKKKGVKYDAKDKRLRSGTREDYRKFFNDVKKSIGEDDYNAWLADPQYTLLDYKGVGRQISKDVPILDNSGQPVKTDSGKVTTESVALRGHTQYPFAGKTPIDGHNIPMALLNPDSLGSTKDTGITIGGHTEAAIMNQNKEMGQWSFDKSKLHMGHGLKRQTNVNPLHVMPITKSKNTAEDKEDQRNATRDYVNLNKSKFTFSPNDKNVLFLFQTIKRDIDDKVANNIKPNRSDMSILDGMRKALAGGKRTGGINPEIKSGFETAGQIDEPEGFRTTFLPQAPSIPIVETTSGGKKFKIGRATGASFLQRLQAQNQVGV